MKKVLLFLLTLSVIGFTGCPTSGPTLPPTTAGGGFFFSTFTSFNLAPPVIAPVTTIQGTWVKDQPGAAGSSSTWTQTRQRSGNRDRFEWQSASRLEGRVEIQPGEGV
jgi:hypothetical protein